MKTKMNTNKLMMALTTFFAIAMSMAVNAQADKGIATADLEALSNMEILMVNVEQSLRYVTPAELENDEVSAEMERLETLVAASEESLKYVAPIAEEAAYAPEMDRLEMLADATEASLKYVAPAAEEAGTTADEMERLDILAAATEASLQYNAPEVTETGINLPNQISELMLAINQ